MYFGPYLDIKMLFKEFFIKWCCIPEVFTRAHNVVNKLNLSNKCVPHRPLFGQSPFPVTRRVNPLPFQLNTNLVPWQKSIFVYLLNDTLVCFFEFFSSSFLRYVFDIVLSCENIKSIKKITVVFHGMQNAVFLYGSKYISPDLSRILRKIIFFYVRRIDEKMLIAFESYIFSTTKKLFWKLLGFHIV